MNLQSIEHQRSRVDAAPTGQKFRLLLVDDEPERLRMLATTLDSEYDLQLALSGERALELIARNQPDLVLMDMVMPGMDGITALSHIRRTFVTRDLPVIVLTARMDIDAEMSALMAGANDFLHVPYNPQVLRTRVAMHIEREQLIRRVARQKDLLQDQVRQEALSVIVERDAAKAATDSERGLCELLDGLPAGVLVCSDQGEIVFANTTLKDIIGMGREDLTGRSIDVLMPHLLESPMHSNGEISPLNGTRQTAGQVRHWHITKLDGTVVAVSVTARQLETADGRRTVYLVRDDSEEQTRADALEAALGVAAETSRAINFSLSEMESFADSLAHDLRAHHNLAEEFSKVIMDRYGDRLDDAGRRVVQQLIDAEERMGRHMGDLLRLTQVSRQGIKPTKLDLSDMVGQAISRGQHANPVRALDVKVAQGVVTRADRELIQMLIDQLVANALQFMATVDNAQIEFGVEVRSSGQQVFYIRDNGIGFNMAKADRLFVPHQSMHGPEVAGVGTCTGLALVSRIVRKHQGQIWAESEPGKGATFYFTLNPKGRSVEDLTGVGGEPDIARSGP